jgi:hypothetical protein
MNPRHIIAGVLLMGLVPATAQQLKSSYFVETSLYRHQLNPALLDSVYVGMPILGNLNIGAESNVGLDNFVYKLHGNVKHDLTTFMSPTVSADEFLGSLSSKTRVAVQLSTNLMSFAFHGLGGVNSVELNLRSATSVNAPYELFEFMKTAGAKDDYVIENINARTTNYMEFALGHSHALNEKLRLGGKLKMLFGLVYSNLNVDHMNISLGDDKWLINANATLDASVLRSDFSHDDNPDPSTTLPGRDKVDGLDHVKAGLAGFGLALDLGATYRITDDLTASASLTDLGFIAWSQNNAASSSGTYTFDGFDDIYAGSHDAGDNKLGSQFDDVNDDLNKMFSFYDDGKKTKTTSLAATLNVAAEYTLPAYRKLRFGLLYSGRFDGIFSYHACMLSTTVHPVKCIEGSINASLTSTGVCWGGMLNVYVRGFNIFIASDRIFGRLSKQYIPIKKANANLCFGLNFPM